MIYMPFILDFMFGSSDICMYICIYVYIYIYISAVKLLLATNHIQNKRFCLHNKCMCTVFIYYVYINTHTYQYIF